MLLQIIKYTLIGLTISGLTDIFTTDNNFLESSQNTRLSGTSYNTETSNDLHFVNKNLHFFNKDQMIYCLLLIIVVLLIHISNTQEIQSENLNNLQQSVNYLNRNNTIMMDDYITISQRLSDIKYMLIRELINLKNIIISNSNAHHNGLVPHLDFQLQNIREELNTQVRNLARLATYVNYTRIYINRSSTHNSGFMENHLSQQRQITESLERVITMLQDFNSTEDLNVSKLSRIISILNNIQRQTSLLITN